MDRETKSKSQTIVFIVAAAIVIFGTAATSFAQSAANTNRLMFGQLLMQYTTRNLWSENVLSESTEPKISFDAKSNLLDDELPPPDFSAMEKWYEVSNVEHDVFAAKMTYLVKAKKEENRPTRFYMQFLDKDGVVVKESYMLALIAWFGNGNTPNEPIKVMLDTPKESVLSKVKAVKVVRYKEE